jgi:hypothetical protein
MSSMTMRSSSIQKVYSEILGAMTGNVRLGAQLQAGENALGGPPYFRLFTRPHKSSS